jgi:glutamate-1-semialdehyde 2,1-aminomutase
VDGVEKLIKLHEEELAMVFAEATLKDIVPRKGFLEALREITEDCDVPLAFDEVVTGLRLAPGGVQERFGVTPDLVVLGKALGGGFPIGALAASNEIMSKFEYPKTLTLIPGKPSIRHPGTFNEHKIAMAAGLATLKELTPSAYENLEMIGQRIRDGLKKIFADLNITAQVTGIGSIFYLYFTDEKVVDDPTAKRANPTLIRHFDLGLLNKGINLAKAHCSYCSVPMTIDDANQTLRAMEETLTDMKQLIHEITPTLVG